MGDKELKGSVILKVKKEVNVFPQVCVNLSSRYCCEFLEHIGDNIFIVKKIELDGGWNIITFAYNVKCANDYDSSFIVGLITKEILSFNKKLFEKNPYIKSGDFSFGVWMSEY